MKTDRQTDRQTVPVPVENVDVTIVSVRDSDHAGLVGGGPIVPHPD
jgi:hypothetical protein